MTKRYVRVGFTAAQKTELWERWRRGEQMKSIGREHLCAGFAAGSDFGNCDALCGEGLLSLGRDPRRLVAAG